jgi:methylmalonyl-CoA mutase C-terminal domain/subunit
MKKTKRIPRVVVAKIGLDGHNRGAYVVAHGLRQAGMEVIYTGLRQTSAAVANAAVQEAADVIGISSMVGAHLSVVKKLKKELARLNASDIPIIIGGIIPEEDYDSLIAAGANKIFPAGAEVREIVQYIQSLLEGPIWVSEVPGCLTGNTIEDLHLLGGKCETCGREYFPMRRNCPHCLDNKPLKEIQLSDEGTLHTFVLADAAPPGYDVPHAMSYIDLDDGGPRIFSLLADVVGRKDLKIGDRMKLKVIERGKDSENRTIMAYRFVPFS